MDLALDQATRGEPFAGYAHLDWSADVADHRAPADAPWRGDLRSWYRLARTQFREQFLEAGSRDGTPEERKEAAPVTRGRKNLPAHAGTA